MYIYKLIMSYGDVYPEDYLGTEPASGTGSSTFIIIIAKG